MDGFRSAAADTLLTSMKVKRSFLAVERNREIVPRTAYADTHLADGDKIEIVTLVGDGLGLFQHGTVPVLDARPIIIRQWCGTDDGDERLRKRLLDPLAPALCQHAVRGGSRETLNVVVPVQVHLVAQLDVANLESQLLGLA